MHLCRYIKYTHLSKCNSEPSVLSYTSMPARCQAFECTQPSSLKIEVCLAFFSLALAHRVYFLPSAFFFFECSDASRCTAVIITVETGLCQCLGLSHTELFSHACSVFLCAYSVVIEDPLICSGSIMCSVGTVLLYSSPA